MLRARFDECQSVAGIGAAMGDRCPMSEHAKRQESVDLRHPGSVLSEICRERWPPESQIDHRGAREVRGKQPADTSLVELRDRALRCCTGSGSVAVRQLHTHIALSKLIESERDQSTS